VIASSLGAASSAWIRQAAVVIGAPSGPRHDQTVY
jgi:hypothetical protein